MAEARQEAEWARTSAVMALMANVNRDAKSKAFTPDDFNPWAVRHKLKRSPKRVMGDINMLRAFLPQGD